MQKGTLKIKKLNSLVNLGKFLPILSCVPSPVRVRIQQDNALVQRPIDMQELEEITHEELNTNVEFVYQPPNSPDTNVLALGMFRSLQALQFQRVSNNEREIIHNVQEVFNSYEGTKINKAFLSLQVNLENLLK